MPPEFIPIQQEIENLWWRVPLGLLPIFLFFLFINYVNEPDISPRREDGTPQNDSCMVGPTALCWLRLCAVAAAARFAWVYFASIDAARNYEISGREACCWLFYIGAVVPIWTWNEKELLCVQDSGNRDAGNTLPEAAALLHQLPTQRRNCHPLNKTNV